MLFRIDNTNVRLAGSLHFVPIGMPVPAWVDQTYSWSRNLYLEADAQAAVPLCLLQPGQTSEQLLPPDVWQSLNSVWKPHLGQLSSLKLWTIPPRLALSLISLDPGVEPRLTRLAKRDSRSVQYLETPLEFSGLADSIPGSICIEGIRWVLDHPSAPDQQIAALYDSWVAGDLEQLTTIFASTPLMRIPEARNALVIKRNLLWLPRIINLLQTQEPTMIVVGAGHLGGQDGLLRMLESAGYDSHIVVGAV